MHHFGIFWVQHKLNTNFWIKRTKYRYSLWPSQLSHGLPWHHVHLMKSQPECKSLLGIFLWPYQIICKVLEHIYVLFPWIFGHRPWSHITHEMVYTTHGQAHIQDFQDRLSWKGPQGQGPRNQGGPLRFQGANWLTFFGKTPDMKSLWLNFFGIPSTNFLSSFFVGRVAGN